MRIERDFLGPMSVPENVLYGISTLRAINNFPVVDGIGVLGAYSPLVLSMLSVKRACAEANRRLQLLERKMGDVIVEACDAVCGFENLKIHFPISVLHGGGGTAANMNVNEVVANLAEELCGGRRGEYRIVDPIAHVNLNQSTNDVYPTACRLAIRSASGPLLSAIDEVCNAFADLGRRSNGLRHMARTCLQDAVIVEWRHTLMAIASQFRRCRTQLESAVCSVSGISVGGGLVGKTTEAPERFTELVCQALRECGINNAAPVVDHFDAAQLADDIVRVAAETALTARLLIKICKDLRWLASGPDCGLGELILPHVQVGSSSLPGKNNPVIPEFCINSALVALGLLGSVGSTMEHAELDLNVLESVQVTGVLLSFDLLTTSLHSLVKTCLQNVRFVDREAVLTVARNPTLEALKQQMGYRAVEDLLRKPDNQG